MSIEDTLHVNCALLGMDGAIANQPVVLRIPRRKRGNRLIEVSAMSKGEPSSDDWLERIMAGLNDRIEIAKSQAEKAFVDNVILQGLPRFHVSWSDFSHNRYFAAAGFHRVVERCIHHGVLVIGIEVFTFKAELLEVRIRDEDEKANHWCFDLLKHYERWKGSSSMPLMRFRRRR